MDLVVPIALFDRLHNEGGFSLYYKMFKSYDDWLMIWMRMTPEELDGLALLRVMECTNGVIQHMYRDGSEHRLSVEQTRTAMNFSMKSMKNLEIPLDGKVVKFNEGTQVHLREARDLYVRAFKKNEKEAMPAFFDCSESCVKVVGEHRINEASYKIDKYLPDVFPEGCSRWGVEYLRRFLT